MNFIGHLGRVEIEIVVAEAGFGGKFLDGKKLNGVDAEVAQIFDPIEDIQKAANVLPLIVSRGIHAKESTDVELIEDVVVEGGRAKSLIVPRECEGRADQTVAVGIGRVGAELAGAGVAFPAGTGVSDYPETVGRTFVEAGDESAPGVIAKTEKARIGGGRETALLRSGQRGAGENEHFSGSGSEDAEGHSARDEIGAKGVLRSM